MDSSAQAPRSLLSRFFSGRRPLQREILLLTVIPLVLAVGTALVVVQASVDRRMREHVEQELEMAEAVLQDALITRHEDLALRARVVARDPKFFALLTVPVEERTADFSPTVYAVAEEFRLATSGDLLQVFDEQGRLIAASGTFAAPDPLAAQAPDLTRAIAGERAVGTLVIGRGLCQVASLPVLAGGHLVGVLRYGKAIDRNLAERLRTLGSADVAFCLNGRTLVSTGAEDPGPSLSRERRLPDLLVNAAASFVLTRSLLPEHQFLARMRAMLAGLGLLFCLLALGVGRWLAIRITRPVKQLLEASSRLERGDYDAPVQAQTADELAALAAAFDSMRRSLRQQINSLAELDQMKSDFLGLASHELRTPVTILQGSLDVLEMSPPEALAPGGPMHEIMIGLKRATRDLRRIVEQVTDMTLLDRRQMKLAMRPVDVGDLLLKIADSHRDDFQARGLGFQLEREPDSLTVLADLERLTQAVEHLVLNAIRFTPDGGRITLRGRGRDSEVTCEVEDTGIGIAEESQRKIFDPLYEAKNLRHHHSGTLEFNSSGMGLGLAICQRIVEAHRGRIELRSSPGQGSLFRVVLPRHRTEEDGGEVGVNAAAGSGTAHEDSLGRRAA